MFHSVDLISACFLWNAGRVGLGSAGRGLAFAAELTILRMFLHLLACGHVWCSDWSSLISLLLRRLAVGGSAAWQSIIVLVLALRPGTYGEADSRWPIRAPTRTDLFASLLCLVVILGADPGLRHSDGSGPRRLYEIPQYAALPA